jgi:hypothetical protein
VKDAGIYQVSITTLARYLKAKFMSDMAVECCNIYILEKGGFGENSPKYTELRRTVLLNSMRMGRNG